MNVPKNMKEKVKEKGNQNNNLHDFGFQNIKQRIKETSKVNLQNTSYQQTIKLKQNLQEKKYLGDKIDKFKLTYFYLNINGLDTTTHKLTQLCITPHSLGISIICLSETNLHWKGTTSHSNSNIS